MRISFFGLAAAAFSLVSCPNRNGEISAVSVMAANIAAMAVGFIGVRGFLVIGRMAADGGDAVLFYSLRIGDGRKILAYGGNDPDGCILDSRPITDQ